MGFITVNEGAISKAFKENRALQDRIYDAISEYPQCVGLFEDIAKHVCSIQEAHENSRYDMSNIAPPPQRLQQQQITPVEGPAPKKRKVANGLIGSVGAGAVGGADSVLIAGLQADADLQLYVQDLSFTIPQRKKLRLEFTQDLGGGNEYIRARNQASGEVEFGVPVAKIQHVLCLPIPEKAQRQFSFCIIPEYKDGITSAPDGTITFEPMVWTVPDAAPRSAYLGSGTPVVESASLAETYQTYFQSVFNGKLKHVKVLCPDEKEFASATPEAHRKSEKAYHVKAFRGSKEGYLFFLATGIFFGFKKPVIFIAFENVESISYTAVLQRTFNLNITARSATKPDEVQELEFSMIDQADYPGIDAYIKKHGLQDASLAEERRAKRLNINAPKGGEADDGQNAKEDGNAHEVEEEESELQKAQKELENRQAEEEDEEEDDYDPGSDGESEGSGSSSEEEEDDAKEGNAGPDEDMGDAE
ncbi:histone chaperone [Arthroderma uncinatum]|uniref:histone chaperone n=1 Tax=Arthroderma uncinatum TaxID=74035 RepID=UPI00144A9D2A|nr:histone chaperone [Arthroderma uncinatum]KAF3491862.1 histone chaperone [Arthroderma uncinatum]